jgi:predicted ATPase
MARHCEAAGLIEKAISYHHGAAEVAIKRCENSEAVGHLTRGIELVGGLPECTERDELELTLREVLGAPLIAVKGWGSEETRRAYARARELCESAGEPARLFQVTRRLLTYYVARAEFEIADDLCNRLLSIAEREPESSFSLVAHKQVAIVLYFKGELSQALEHYQRALSLYDPPKHEYLTELYGEDVGVFVRIWMAWDLWLLGSPDQARDRCREAVELGAEAGHPFSHSYALLWSAVLHVMRREREKTHELAEGAVAISERLGFDFVLRGGRLIRDWARIDPEGEDEAVLRSIDEFQESLVQLAAGGTQVCGPQIFGYLADAYCERGREADGLTAVDTAIGLSKRTRQHYWDAELYRVKGKLLLQQQGEAHGEAEELFRRALHLARSQKARSLELRAAMSLCRLWRERGATDEARELLAPIYGSFTEGFGTADLREGRRLLDELA